MRQLRQFIFVSIIGLMSALSFSVQAAKLIAIIGSDTLDDSIGKSVQKDFDKVNAQMQTIANYTGLTLEPHVLSGKANTTKNMIKNLKAVQAGDQDVIFFYYSGHGFRTYSKDGNLWPYSSDSDPWPYMVFTQDNDRAIDYDFVVYTLMEKHPRLLITISDVCNSYIDDYSAPPIVTRMAVVASSADVEKIRENYQHLFLDDEGMINMTGSTKGEYSTGNDSRGGAFTSALLKSLDTETKTASVASWKTLIQRASKKVTDDSIAYAKKHGGIEQADRNGDIQRPYFELHDKNSN